MLFGSWLLGAALVAAQAGSNADFDLVIRGGRVIDPESGTDAVRDVGISDGRIARVSEGPLAGRRVVDAKGLVVAPGFIDLHQHGQDQENDRKMSLMPAQRLEAATPLGRGKGRIREGADADIVVFDAETVADQSTYEEPSRPSTGFRFVLVGGTPVVDGGRLVEGVRPGRALTGR